MCRRCLALLGGLALLAACTRSRPVPSPTGEELPQAPPAIDIAISVPAAGANVASPVGVEGTVSLPSGLALVAQIKRRDADGSEHWLANRSLAVAADGRFTGSVPYVLSARSPGVVEVIVVEPSGGTVLERRDVEVGLAASP